MGTCRPFRSMKPCHRSETALLACARWLMPAHPAATAINPISISFFIGDLLRRCRASRASGPPPGARYSAGNKRIALAVSAACESIWGSRHRAGGRVDKTSFERLVFDLRDAHLRGSGVIRLLEELDALPAIELVLDLHQVADDLLPRVAAVARYLGVKRPVKIAGLRGQQIHEITALGIEPQAILIG